MLTKRVLTLLLKENKEEEDLGRELQRLETEGTNELREEEVRQKGIQTLLEWKCREERVGGGGWTNTFGGKYT